MYICIETGVNVKPREVVVIKSDNAGGIGAYLIDGSKVGYLMAEQPDGCVSYWKVAGALFDNRVLCDVAISCDGMAILHTESRLLSEERVYERVTKEGYSFVMCK